MPTYNLFYFNGRGRAEVCRILFAAAGVHYTDRRIKISEWNRFKNKMNFSILPVLQIDGETEIPQSMAIARYLAREFGFHGKNNVDMARIESICDCLNDILDDYLQLYYEKNFSKKAALRDHYNDTCRRILPFLEKTLGQYDNGAKYFFGEQIMLCDMMCYAALESPINDNQTILKDYPKLRNLRHRVVCHPQISAYILKRSDTTF
ncbi:S-crystallin SL11-like isoform X2 [Octopus bimaculoides]|uniref:S-crystallin SL11-like isoform X2 n=1 Tax=Octopus bimaculoides TaxID=37653 RepID=UPI00071E2C0D|nr:S-crystallin SL11-like isoform X2 [Octopus bimaculoides]|eukprot:XP_014789700.1 PREDICTED: S-crystallin SL11-like [Octopus bimaculoides]